MEKLKKQMLILKIVSIAVVILFVLLSMLDCVKTYEEVTVYDQSTDVDKVVLESTTTESSYTNHPIMVASIGAVEVILILVACYRLGTVTAVVHVFLTAGTFLTPYIKQMIDTIYGGMSYTFSLEVTPVGYTVTVIAIVNVILTVVLQIKKKALEAKGLEESAVADGRVF